MFVAVDHHTCRVRRPPCRPPGHPLRGAGAAAPGRARALRRLSPRRLRAAWPSGTTTAATTCRDDFQEELAFLGIESSPAFVRAPEGNGCAERFIRTLKENLLWVRSFDTVEELRQALRESYNTIWLIERHGFQTPDAVRQNHFHLRPSPRRLQSGVSKTAGGTRPPSGEIAPDGMGRAIDTSEHAEVEPANPELFCSEVTAEIVTELRNGVAEGFAAGAPARLSPGRSRASRYDLAGGIRDRRLARAHGLAVEMDGAADPDMPLLWILRDLLNLTGTKFGCGRRDASIRGRVQPELPHGEPDDQRHGARGRCFRV